MQRNPLRYSGPSDAVSIGVIAETRRGFVANDVNSIQRYTTNGGLSVEFICLSNKYWLDNFIIQESPGNSLNPFIPTLRENEALIPFACPIDKLLNEVHDLKPF